MEHIVDAVLYFEGERNLSCRILRTVKNRYGSTNEIGVFEMLDKGLCEVENPSQMLLSGRPEGVSGTCVTCTMGGTASYTRRGTGAWPPKADLQLRGECLRDMILTVWQLLSP